MWNPTSQGRLQGVDPRLVGLMEAVREKTGITFEVSEGLRDKSRQEQMVAQGKSQTMNSRHLTGNALDVHILGEDGKPVWDFDAYVPLGEAFKQEAAARGYDDAVWGGDWKSLRDGVHFQLGGGGHQHANENALGVGPTQARADAGMPLNTRTPSQVPNELDRLMRARMVMSMMPQQRNLLNVEDFMS